MIFLSSSPTQVKANSSEGFNWKNKKNKTFPFFSHLTESARLSAWHSETSFVFHFFSILDRFLTFSPFLPHILPVSHLQNKLCHSWGGRTSNFFHISWQPYLWKDDSIFNSGVTVRSSALLLQKRKDLLGSLEWNHILRKILSISIAIILPWMSNLKDHKDCKEYHNKP